MQTFNVEGLLAMVPVRSVPFETSEAGHVVLLRPKFVSPWLAWLQPLLSRPVFRVKLDEVGSFLWSQIDGVRTVDALCDQLGATFGERAEPVRERGLSFIYQLLEGRFLELRSDR